MRKIISSGKTLRETVICSQDIWTARCQQHMAVMDRKALFNVYPLTVSIRLKVAHSRNGIFTHVGHREVLREA